MRRIKKGSRPNSLVLWANASKGVGVDVTYSDMPGDVRADVLASLVAEQGGLCAYTGIRINSDRAHIEHLLAQAHCVGASAGQDIEYKNMVACFPAPNTGTCGFGAHRKGSWPDPNRPDEAGQFVSPLSVGCDRRFRYVFSGKVRGADGDFAATTTIEKLNLNDAALIEMRRAAIRNTFAPRGGSMSKAQAETRLHALRAQVTSLDAFHFVLVQQLECHISPVK